MLLSLVATACGTPTPSTTTAPVTSTTSVTPSTTQTTTTATQTQPTTTSASDKPKYGGRISTYQISDPTTWDNMRSIAAGRIQEQTFSGDWAKGPAGGYGANLSDWAWADNDIFDMKAGFCASSAKWTIDTANSLGTIVWQIRQGVHFGLNTKFEASRLVNGREMTADDIIYSFKRSLTYTLSYVFINNPDLRSANITKTGPWEVTMVVPLSQMMPALARFNDTVPIVPHEVVEKYGDMDWWNRVVGTGPFMYSDYVAGSEIDAVRNPNYWQKNPVGPGKGDQLPYLDGYTTLIIPDKSTYLAALRVGKLDQMELVQREDARDAINRVPQLKWIMSTSNQGRGNPPLNMRIDTSPFTDIRVRKAMMMSVDYQSILKNYWGGEGQIYTFPCSDVQDYHELYLEFKDYSDAAKELYSYNPEKARQLLKEAGYPNGFKTSIICTNEWIDFFSIYKDYFSKIGIDMALDIKTPQVLFNMTNLIPKTFTQMAQGDTAPIAVFYNGQQISGQGQNNRSMVNDPFVNDQIAKIKLTAITDIHQAMAMYKELTKYVVEQAFAVPAVVGSYYVLWWPWLGGYSGERFIGYDDSIWPAYIWYDQDLKKAMGH
jgi:peptide/nickel transport system substrate-binding protein